jgi:hypothetical protein
MVVEVEFLLVFMLWLSEFKLHMLLLSIRKIGVRVCTVSETVIFLDF